MSQIQQPSCFTTTYPGIVNQLVTDIHVCYPIINGNVIPGPGNDPNTFFPTKAIWDTGATNTTITRRAAEALGLQPIGKGNVTGVNSTSVENVHLAGLILPNGVRFSALRVTECESLSHPNDPIQCDVLLGMDVISHGDLAISNLAGQTVLSFRMPSLERTDYVQDVNNGVPILPPGANRQMRRQAAKKKKRRR